MAEANAGMTTMFAPEADYTAVRALMAKDSPSLVETVLTAVWQVGRAAGAKELVKEQQHIANNAATVINGLMHLAGHASRRRH